MTYRKTWKVFGCVSPRVKMRFFKRNSSLWVPERFIARAVMSKEVAHIFKRSIGFTAKSGTRITTYDLIMNVQLLSWLHSLISHSVS